LPQFLLILNQLQILYGTFTRMRAIARNISSGKSGQLSGFDLTLHRDTAQVVVKKITVP
jgi:hypothetical protein